VAANPEAGEIILETGGIRKIRWALQGTGKRGGARVVYYYPRRAPAGVPASGVGGRVLQNGIGKFDMSTKKTSRPTTKKATRRRKLLTVGESTIQELKEAIAWTKGEDDNVHVTLVHVPEVDVRKVRLKMGLSQAQFATKFGFPPATLRNWEQGRSHPDAPTRVLLAVIAKHPEAVEDVLRKAG
jgi:putative transcriptional regulator